MLNHPIIHEAFANVELRERLAAAELRRLAREVPRPERRTPQLALARRALRTLASAGRAPATTSALHDR